MGNWRKKMERARRLHRPSLKNWQVDGMAEIFPLFVRELQTLENYQSFFLDEDRVQSQAIPAVLDAASLTPEDFNKYEIDDIPAVIRNIPAGYDGGQATTPWPAKEKWQLEALEKNNTLLDRLFKCGEDDDGKNIKIKLKQFLKYTRDNSDDSPLYIFDSAFDEDRYADRILTDYRVPSYFKDDLFGLVSESRRPPYRWFLIGPERSGSCVHIDPLATSAWNTLVSGQKRWVVFPPHVPKSIVKGKGLVRKGEDDEAVHYFSFILPRIKHKAQSLRDQPQYKDFCCYEFTQNAGETVFIPNGWWHAVLNLTHSVAITQNFCSPRNFDKVWLKTRSGRKKMAWKWLGRLEKEYPELAERAKAMNKRDNYVMKYDPVEIERREREERRRKKERKQRKQQKEVVRWERLRRDSPRPAASSDQESSLKRSRVELRATVSP
jgi:histone arginine demethylase JMJD6